MTGQGNPVPTRTSYQAGRSGNPGGRPADREIAALARRYTPDAIRTLVEVCRASDNASSRVAAANALLDRGWGKPRQEVDVAGGVGQALHLHLYAVQRLEQTRELVAQLEAPPIEGTVEDFSAVLLDLPALPEEALPLWDAARRPTREETMSQPGKPDDTPGRGPPDTPPGHDPDHVPPGHDPDKPDKPDDDPDKPDKPDKPDDDPDKPDKPDKPDDDPVPEPRRY